MSCTFTHGGHEFTVEIEPDYDMSPPWEEHEGHGLVRESLKQHFSCCSDKKPSERPLNRAERQYYYDVAATMKLAARDGWGVIPEVIEAFTAKHGRAPTRGQVIALSVEADFQYMSKYLAGDVSWYQVSVTHAASGEYVSLGGILCEHGDQYLIECMQEIAEEILYTLRKKQETLDLHMAGL